MNDLRKAAELALTALDTTCPNIWHSVRENLRKSLAQSEQKPVAWMCEGDDWGTWVPVVFLGNDLEYHKKSSGFRNWKPLYTAPPKREWVGLTDEEIYDYADKFLYQHGSNYGIKSFGKAIEAKLKEKNGG